ncbi:hypothetical protein PF008_g31194 [Phytophthora fragariae]|uniref:Retrovirus-related Pol polyprotein from transposon TNT 1-94-like beta-barrel domain-containing protein n=1 Tax=Phytophthora fragariae TaxID=53985 RepID=A0A6G0Q3H3_9STRA|nr:hypothetical protein PF008_g31194 [Phytophthora fragariae]
MTSVRDKLKTPVRITIADGKKIDVVAMGTVGWKLMDGTLSDVFYVPGFEGNLISVVKLAEKDGVAQFSKDTCLSLWRCYRHGDQALWKRLQVKDSVGRGVSCGDGIS